MPTRRGLSWESLLMVWILIAGGVIPLSAKPPTITGQDQSFKKSKQLGIYNLTLGKYKDAEFYFKQALKFQEDPECYKYLAEIYDHLNDPAQAQRYRLKAGIQGSTSTDSNKNNSVTQSSGTNPTPVSTTSPTPSIEILSPVPGATVCSQYVTLRYRLKSGTTSTPIKLEILVNDQLLQERGQRIKAASTSQAQSDAEELQIVIPPRDSTITLVATASGAPPLRTSVRLTWCPESLIVSSTGSHSDQSDYKPKLYVLAIGVSDYADVSLKLGYPAKDATDFAGVLKQQKGLLYEDVTVKLLTNRLATTEDILNGLQWIKKETTTKDVAMIFFAGHGVNEDETYYFLPYNTDTANLLRTGVSFSAIKTTINSMAGKKLLFVDTCHSGNVFGTSNRRGAPNPDIGVLVQELRESENGTVIFTASTGRQASLENSAWENGAFTKALVEGLKGQADIKNRGKISVTGLEYYIYDRVKELTGGRQTPTTAKPDTVVDYPIAILPKK